MNEWNNWMNHTYGVVDRVTMDNKQTNKQKQTNNKHRNNEMCAIWKANEFFFCCCFFSEKNWAHMEFLLPPDQKKQNKKWRSNMRFFFCCLLNFLRNCILRIAFRIGLNEFRLKLYVIRKFFSRVQKYASTILGYSAYAACC